MGPFLADRAVIVEAARIRENLARAPDRLIGIERQLSRINIDDHPVGGVLAHHDLARTGQGLAADKLDIRQVVTRVHRDRAVIRQSIQDPKVVIVGQHNIGAVCESDTVELRTVHGGADLPTVRGRKAAAIHGDG